MSSQRYGMARTTRDLCPVQSRWVEQASLHLLSTRRHFGWCGSTERATPTCALLGSAPEMMFWQSGRSAGGVWRIRNRYRMAGHHRRRDHGRAGLAGRLSRDLAGAGRIAFGRPHDSDGYHEPIAWTAVKRPLRQISCATSRSFARETAVAGRPGLRPVTL